MEGSEGVEAVKKFRVCGVITISVYTEVEAETPEEARKLAEEQPVMTLCHYCVSGEPDREWVTNGELDGTPAPDSHETELYVEEL